MDINPEPIQETVYYEPDSLFLFHHNYRTDDYPKHWHDAVEIVMPIQNIYTVTVGNQTYNLREHDILIIPPGQPHEMKAPKAAGQRIMLQFSLEILNTIRGFIKSSYIFMSHWQITPENNPELHESIKNLIYEMLDEFLNRNIHYNAAITNKIIGIALHLTRKKQAENDFQCEVLIKRKEHTERLSDCIDYISHNLNENLTLETVAQAVGFSKFHFSRWFREIAGLSFHDYLAKVRIDKAETMLLSTSLSITEIVMEAGFQSTNTFNRLFKKYMNCTPTEYRQLYNIKQKQQLTLLHNGDGSDNINICSPPPPADIPNPSSRALSRVNSDGTVANPFIWADIPDPDVIRVNDYYYMISTTMHFSPGIPVMKSCDLVHWEIVSYVYDILDDSDACALRNDTNAYGKGSWAGCLRYHNGIFYVAAASFTTKKTYIFQTEDIENGPWRRYEIDEIFHDLSMLFDDDGRVYIVHGSGTIHLVELNSDATDVLAKGTRQVIIENANAGGNGGLPAEGSHLYKIDGRYYLFLIAWPSTGTKRRIELCYRSDEITGSYEGRVVLDDNMGYKNMGVAQGGIVNTPGGSWYGLLFQDHGAVGRTPVLVPVTWDDGWPVFGTNGCVPEKLKLPLPVSSKSNIVVSDEFYPQNISKCYTASNRTSYLYRHLSQNNSDNVRDKGSDLLLNGCFKDGTDHWGVMEVAEITMTEDETFNELPVLQVVNRSTTASGPRQIITGKVKPGGVYEVLAWVKYTSGPQSNFFNICIRNGTEWKGIQIMGSEKVVKGEWCSIKGTYTLPDDADLSETSVFIETPWSEKPKKEKDMMDFYVGSVSVTAKPLLYNTRGTPGENDPIEQCLGLSWQWNHNPDNNLWSLTERPSFLRLKSGYLSRSFLDARNTLTQRTFGPKCAGAVSLDVRGMRDGDIAGLAALQELYGYVGVKKVNGYRYITMCSAVYGQAREIKSIPLNQDYIYLRLEFDFDDADSAKFYYSLDEIKWRLIGETLPLDYRLSHFTGYRFALFYYSTQTIGGYADFDYFRLCDTINPNSKKRTILKASLSCGTTAAGVKGETIAATIHLQALPADTYKGIYLSMPLPAILDVADVEFCHAHITGTAGYTTENNRLCISVTGEKITLVNSDSDMFAVIRFTVNDYVTKDTSITLKPDYIYVDGENAAYQTHDISAAIDIAVSETGAAAKVPGYANPLISHKYGADPWALEYGGRLYLYLTGDTYEYDLHGRLLENTYGKINTINVISSADLINWTDHGEIVVAGANGAAKWAVHSWAPAVACKNIEGKDKFFLYFANDASNIGVLTSESPLGPWVDPINSPLIHRGLPGVDTVTWCFDPAVLIDDDGQGYIYFGGGLPSHSDKDVLHPRTARVIRLGEDMTSTVGEAVVIDAPALFEDSGIHKYNGRYYYSYCSNFVEPHPCGYPPCGEIAYMTADHPMGPFTYVGAILKNPTEAFDVGGNNHHCIFTFKGAWYIAYHAQTLAKSLNRAKGYRSPHINHLSYYSNGQIRPVTADMKGAAMTGFLNPYERTPAAAIAWCSGIETAPHTKPQNGMYVSNVRNGSWLAVANADFGNSGASHFSARVAPRIGGEIEIRLDSTQGEIVGSLGCGSTDNNHIWVVRSCGIKTVTGIHNIFFIFKGDNEENLLDFDYWKFEI